MPRTSLYPEGRAQMNVIVSKLTKEAFEAVARDRRQSVSQIVSVVLEDHVRRLGYLRERAAEKVPA